MWKRIHRCSSPAASSGAHICIWSRWRNGKTMLRFIWTLPARQMTATYNLSLCVSLTEWWQKHSKRGVFSDTNEQFVRPLCAVCIIVLSNFQTQKPLWKILLCCWVPVFFFSWLFSASLVCAAFEMGKWVCIYTHTYRHTLTQTFVRSLLGNWNITCVPFHIHIWVKFDPFHGRLQQLDKRQWTGGMTRVVLTAHCDHDILYPLLPLPLSGETSSFDISWGKHCVLMTLEKTFWHLHCKWWRLGWWTCSLI